MSIITFIAPAIVGQIGGTEVVLTGTFTIGRAYNVYMGINEDATDSSCYSGIMGNGYRCFSENGVTLPFVSPKVFNGSLSAQKVTVMHSLEDTSHIDITVIEVPLNKEVFTMRKYFSKWIGVGVRSADLEKRQMLT